MRSEAERAQTDAALLCADEARAFELGMAALVSRVRLGYVLSAPEQRMLQGMTLITSVQRGHALSESETALLQELGATTLLLMPWHPKDYHQALYNATDLALAREETGVPTTPHLGRAVHP